VVSKLYAQCYVMLKTFISLAIVSVVLCDDSYDDYLTDSEIYDADITKGILENEIRIRCSAFRWQ